MRPHLALVLAGVLVVAACGNDAALPSETIPAASARADMAAQAIADAVYRGLPAAEQRGVTIGVLAAWRTENSAVVLIAPTQGAARYRRFTGGGTEWRDAGEFMLQPQRAGAAPSSTAADLDYDPIAVVQMQGGGSGYMYHQWDVRAGSYYAYANSSYPKISSGGWYGGAHWVADTLFEYRFTRWLYNGNDYYCSYGTRISTNQYTSFMVQTSQGMCAATNVSLNYSIAKVPL